jgi:hypothetical protein
VHPQLPDARGAAGPEIARAGEILKNTVGIIGLAMAAIGAPQSF